jgi:hypothetical protein
MKIRNARMRHGHAPGHVRDTFCSAINAFLEWEPDDPEPMVAHEVNYEPQLIPISRACTLLWNCTDIVPGPDFQRLREDAQLQMKMRTYAACARAMYAAILQQRGKGSLTTVGAIVSAAPQQQEQ